MNSAGLYEFEDEVIVGPSLFWMDRQDLYWNEGWELFKPLIKD